MEVGKLDEVREVSGQTLELVLGDVQDCEIAEAAERLQGGRRERGRKKERERESIKYTNDHTP